MSGLLSLRKPLFVNIGHCLYHFRDLMRDNMIINPTGRQGRAMGVDQNIECHINYLKVCPIVNGE